MTKEKKLALYLFRINWIGVVIAIVPCGYISILAMENTLRGGFFMTGFMLIPNVMGLRAHYGYYAIYRKGLPLSDRQNWWAYSIFINSIFCAIAFVFSA